MATSQLNDEATVQFYSQRLQKLMTQAGLSSYRSLSTMAGVSRWAIDLLRQGQVGKLRIDSLLRLSRALQVPPIDLITEFEAKQEQVASAPALVQDIGQFAALHQEYARLQQRLASQEQEIRQQVQREVIARLESWLLQWPTAVYAAQQNETIPATRLIPLAKPLEQLFKDWELNPIGEVGEEVTYDPQLHQPMGTALVPGQRARVRYVGYWQGDRLLYRAKVSRVE
ncbi:MAG: helix-turn-helix transcriptional regulator [Leptolyngbyaceae cyanobacterium SM2_5_2]|nr:helix-turn-helix transcriptional regulator [Leptolyngbyaceae cyanobacterium SM2_5_2]